MAEKPKDEGSDYDAVVYEGVTHLVPAGEQFHFTGESCECEPLTAVLVGGHKGPALVHRSMALPRPA